MIECQEADVLAAAMSVGSLDSADETTLNSHLAGCADCRRVTAEYMAAAGLLALAAEPMRPSPELRSRLMRAVYSEAIQAERPRRVPFLQRLLGLVPAGRGYALAAGVAAGVIIGGSAVAGVTRQASPAPSSSVAFTLTGQRLSPKAHGRIDYNASNQEAMMTVTGLATPSQVSAGGAVYEVWLIPAKGNPVPAAYLTRSPNGSSWTAAVQGDLTNFAAIAATIEPAGGSPTPTGGEVVQGTINPG